jgi:ComF family protein
MFKSIINLFFPSVCAGCNSFLLKNEIVICTRCRHEIPQTNHHINPNNEVVKRFYGRIDLEFGAAFLYFHKEGIVQNMIHKLKYKGHEEIGEIIGVWYADELKNIPELKTIDYIIPVPLHKKRLKERGYNQVTTFGKALSKNLNIPYKDDLLIRKIYSKTQTKKNLLNRTDISNDIFDITIDKSQNSNHYLLIDDVMTTGSTLEACARKLLEIPNSKVSILCMAMSHS